MKNWTRRGVLGGSLAVLPWLVVAGGAGYAHAAGIGMHASQGYLGVDFRDVGDDQVGVLKLQESRGEEIIRVDHDGPAGKAGLREHDVILQMNGQVVEGREQLRRMLRETQAGRTVTLVISRDGQQQTISAAMANREEVERQAWQQHMTVPEPATDGSSPASTYSAGRSGGEAAPRGGMGFLSGGGAGFSGTRGDRGLPGMNGSPYTGAMLEPVGPQLAEFFGVQGGTGLLVESVEANSPAATAGMRAGDVVVKVNQVSIASVGDWARTVHESKGRPVPVTVLREKKEQTLTLTPDPKRRTRLEWPDLGPGYAGVTVPESEQMVAEMRTLLEPLRSELGVPAREKSLEELRQRIRELQDEMADLLD